MGYENEGLGEGIVGKYYNDENFGGEPKLETDINIDFFNNNDNPTDGINVENFSVHWNGFLRAPRKENYVFYIRCDDGCWFSINGEIIV